MPSPRSGEQRARNYIEGVTPMPHTIKSSDLVYMTEEERRKALAELVNATRQNGDADRTLLRARVRQYELRYEMRSDEMLKQYAAGKIRETAEIADWLFWLGVLKDNGWL